MLYIESGIQRVCNFIKEGEDREAMMLLRDIETNVMRYDFKIMGEGFFKFAEIYASQNKKKKAIEMYQKAIMYIRETGDSDKIVEISKRFEDILL